ncbi:hemerythrin domain-containing protein [Microbacterium horticulturae]|uniref:Hemerythrin domain-containing protein n=1 Tax=Microbacterium horticulturae TaxID=3028316 RepID=A0ABY8C4X4_9MICO|nr:hemerythrin domain-containing protein [Microbacterium sp. KACC 23027]WEG10111.1 hemerythrin domain-containing protein [Microbacterium sp. KACC 23027]
MSDGTVLADALTREHHDIDTGIEAYLTGLDSGGDAAPLHTAMHALRRHIYLEETFLFPPLRAGGLMMAIMVMEREHGELWRAMDALEHTLVAPRDPEELRDACRSLLALLDDHNSKEEPVVYPRADADLTDQQRTQLAAFLESGTFPDGWVCAKT